MKVGPSSIIIALMQEIQREPEPLLPCDNSEMSVICNQKKAAGRLILDFQPLEL